MDAMERRAQRTGARADAAAFDGFKNELTGIGSWLKDKTFGGKRGGPDFEIELLSGFDCEQRWRGSDLGARIIEAIPDEMVREGFKTSIQPTEKAVLEEDVEGEDVEAPPFGAEADPIEDPEDSIAEDDSAAGEDVDPAAEKEDAFPPKEGAGPPPMAAPPEPTNPKPIPELEDDGTEDIEALEAKFEELCVDDVFWDALCYERAYGGAAILLGVDDGMPLDQPLDLERIKDVTHLTALRGGWDGEIVAWSWNSDITKPGYGTPDMYMVRNIGTPVTQLPTPTGTGTYREVQPTKSEPYGNLIYWVHASRLLVFPGIAPSRRTRVQMRGWGDSIFTRVDRVLSQYDQTWGAVANIMTDFSQGYLKVKGLLQMMGANNRTGATQGLLARARNLQLTRSISNLLLLDADGEEFGRDTASLAGIGELMDKFALRLSAACDMPVTLLMGQAPAGLNATGASDVRFFYDRVMARIKKRMLPQRKRLTKVLFLAADGPTSGDEPERWNVEPNALYQLDELQLADLRLKDSQTDSNRIKDGILSPEEVAAAAYGGSEYSSERTIDFEGRKKMAEQDARDKAEKQKAMLEAGLHPDTPPQLAATGAQPDAGAQPAAPKKPFGKADAVRYVWAECVMCDGRGKDEDGICEVCEGEGQVHVPWED